MRTIFFILLSAITLISCNRNNTSDQELMRDVEGTITWGGSPAVDGTGLLFHSHVSEDVYGVAGDKGDYEDIFDSPTNEVEVIADFYITDNETVRGWGITYTEIRIVDIDKLDSTQ